MCIRGPFPATLTIEDPVEAADLLAAVTQWCKRAEDNVADLARAMRQPGPPEPGEDEYFAQLVTTRDRLRALLGRVTIAVGDDS